MEIDYKRRPSPQVIGNAGMYFCCYQLSRLGWNVMPTARNARGVDIIAYNHDASKFISIQVKSLSKKIPVPLGKSLDRIMGDYWVIINNLEAEPAVFVMLPNEVKQFAHRGVKDENVSYWLQPKQYDKPEFRDAWHRITN